MDLLMIVIILSLEHQSKFSQSPIIMSESL